MLTFYHAKLVAGDLREMARFRKHLLGASADSPVVAQVMHERDKSCCRRERWGETWGRIVAALGLPPSGARRLDVDARWPGRRCPL